MTNISIPNDITVRSLADLMKKSPTDVIGKLIKNGVMAHINQTLDYDTAALIAADYGFEVDQETEDARPKWSTTKNSSVRPPIVTVMGHVDHGKTSLLDYIRSSKVAAGESGGITQHISSYQIDYQSPSGSTRKITFIDTPGHEAFSALREHGASITDIVILIIAANDGVKPQTIEVIEHTKKLNLPVVVAINKTDLPDANIDLVKRQLADNGLMSEDWGGKVVMVPISAKTGKGVDDLLEMVILTADMLELKGDADMSLEGIIMEGRLDPKVGPLATALVYNGTLRVGQVVVTGKTYGRVKRMTDDQGKEIDFAGPATPAIISGLKDVPEFGQRIEVVPNEKTARDITEQRSQKSSQHGSSSENTYKIILKADVGGSLAALTDSIKKLKHRDAIVEVVSSGIAAVNENDINMAKTCGSVVVAFRVDVPSRISKYAEQEGVEIRQSFVIYEILEKLSADLEKIASPIYTTEEVGKLKVLEVFSRKKETSIVGGEVLKGHISKNLDVQILRSQEEIGKGVITLVKIGKLEVDMADEKNQCGMAIDTACEIEKGDVILATKTVKS